MLLFRDCLELCELMDLGFSGTPFTYDNGQMGDRNVRVRLDRACADEALWDLFPFAQVTHLTTSCSDHVPLMIRLAHEEPLHTEISPRYEIMWERHETGSDTINSAWTDWGGSNSMEELRAKLQAISQDLGRWNNDTFGNVRKEIKSLKT